MNAAAVRGDWEGQVVDGRFPLLQWLGGSHRSAVFRTELNGQRPQKAAIKIISADPASAQRHLDRWQLAASLSHPHLLRIFHFGRCQINASPRLYVVMEYAEEDLSQVLPVRPLSVQETGAMLRPVVDVLTYLHQRGLAHGHVQPSNIMAIGDQLMLSSDRVHPVGEFGGASLQLNAYDAPEVASSAMTRAADVWSLGATVVAVFTQHPPAWRRSEPVELSVPESIPEPFHSIARGCLQRNPNDRITLEHVKSSLHPASPVSEKKQGSPVSARAVPRPVMAVVIVLLLMAAFFAVRWTTRGSRSSGTQTPGTQASPEQAVSGSEQPTTKSPQPIPVSKPTSGVVRVPGEVLERVEPDVSVGARRTIQGRIRVTVRVAVDATGKVSDAVLTSPGPSRYFANKAQQAARGWKFKPAEVGGQPVASQWLLRFQFGQAKTEVFPTPADR